MNIENQKIEKNLQGDKKQSALSKKTLHASYFIFLTSFCIFLLSCHIYSFKDVTIDPDIKTIKVGFIENKARFVNPQLSPQLTDRLHQKIINQTRLISTNNDDAHLQVNGYISQYDVTTAGISNQQAATNRLTVGVHIVVRNTLKNTTQEFDVTRNFDFSASLSLTDAQNNLTDEILRNLTDDIFNHLFSNW